MSMKRYDFLLTRSLLSLFYHKTWSEVEKCEEDDRILYEQCNIDPENLDLKLVFNLEDSNKFTLILSLSKFNDYVYISSRDFLEPYFYGGSYRESITGTFLTREAMDVNLSLSDIIYNFSKIGSEISNLRKILLSKSNFVDEIEDNFYKVYFSKLILKDGMIFPPITFDSILYSLFLTYRFGILNLSKEFSVDYISRITLLGLYSCRINGGTSILSNSDFFLNLPLEKLERVYDCFVEYNVGMNLLRDSLEDKYGFGDILRFNNVSSNLFNYAEEKLIFGEELLNALKNYDRS